jgi:hypothetical protein
VRVVLAHAAEAGTVLLLMRYGGSSSAGSSGGGSTTLEISFMSIQRPSTGMVRRNREISRAQNSAARGSRKSGKYTSPGHTLPR